MRETTRNILAAMLVIAFFLPLSRCDHSKPVEAPQSLRDDASLQAHRLDNDGIHAAKGRKPRYRDTYAYENIRGDSPVTWFIPLAYFWGVAIILVRLRFAGHQRLVQLKYLELLCCLGTAYILFYMTLLEDQLLIGGWLAVIATSTWLALIVYEFVSALYRRFVRQNE